jgi:alkanesulfonate monooxygenase SsuD/methylene tetrahydromethanopterin reductase-like flavin-dependent oxidoreductase (luciferase family)
MDFSARHKDLIHSVGVGLRATQTFHVGASEPMKIAVLDDYQNVALKMADWSALSGRTEITVFNDHLGDPSAVVERLLPFDIVCVMRERTPLPREVLQHLPG